MHTCTSPLGPVDFEQGGVFVGRVCLVVVFVRRVVGSVVCSVVVCLVVALFGRVCFWTWVF